MVLIPQALIALNAFLVCVFAKSTRRFTTIESLKTNDTANSPSEPNDKIQDAPDYIRLNISLVLGSGLGAIIVIIIFIWVCMHQSNKARRLPTPRRWPAQPNKDQLTESSEIKPYLSGNSIYEVDGSPLPIPEADGIGRVEMAGDLGGTELQSNNATHI